MRYTAFFLLLFLGAVFTCPKAFCQTDNNSILSSIKPISLIARQLLPPEVIIQTLLGSHDDPHHFSLAYSDLKALKRAKVVIWLGPDLERFLKKPLTTRSSLQLSELKGLRWPDLPRADHWHHEDHAHTKDMHIWLNPDNVIIIMKAMAVYFSTAFPQHKIFIHQQLDNELSKISQLKNEIAEILNQFSDKRFGVSHDAVRHFSQAFNMHQLAAISILPEQRLSLKKISQLQKNLEDAKCILSEPGDLQAKRIAHRIDLPVIDIDVLGRSSLINSVDDLLHKMSDSFAQCFRSVQLKR